MSESDLLSGLEPERSPEKNPPGAISLPFPYDHETTLLFSVSPDHREA